MAAVLRGLGLQTVRPSSAGSSNPDPAGTDPQLLARNRRVTVYRKSDGYSPPPEPTAPKLPDRPTGLAADTRVKVNLVLRELLGRKVKITPNVIGELRVFLKDSKSDPVTAGVTDRRASARADSGVRKGPGGGGVSPESGPR